MADEKFVVELVEDVSGPAKKAASGVRLLIDQTGKIQGAFRSANGDLKLVNGQLAGFSNGTEKGALASLSLKKVLLGAGVVYGLRKLKDGLIGVTESLIDYAAFAQRGALAFQFLKKPWEDAGQLFKQDSELAAALGFDVQDTVHQFQKFRAMQFSQDQSETLVKMGADLQAIGASSENVKSIWLAMTQIKSLGKLQGQDLRQLAQAGVSNELIYKALEKRLGKTREEIVKMQQAGQIDAGTGLNAIGEAILHKTNEKDFGEAGARFADSTFAGMANRIKSRGQLALLGIGEKVAPAVTRLMGLVSGKVNAFLDSDKGKNFLSGVGDTFSKVIGFVERAIPLVELFVTGFSSGFGETLSAIREGFSGGEVSIKEWIPVVKALGRGLGQLIAIGIIATGLFVAVGAGLATLAAVSWEAVSSIGSSFIDGLGNIFFSISDWWANLTATWEAKGLSLWEKTKKIGGMLVEGLVDGINYLADLPGRAVDAIGSSVVSGFKKVLGINSPSRVFRQLGTYTAVGYEQGIVAQTPAVRSATSKMLTTEAPLVTNRASGLSLGMAPAATGAGRATPTITFSPVFNVTAAPGATREDGQELMDGMFAQIERSYKRLLDQQIETSGS